jgi:DNA replication and repair protein RecF
MLLDDVMSELDAGRRERLVEVLRAGGQSVVTTTDLAHVPGAEDPGVERVAIAGGRVLQATPGEDATDLRAAAG